MGPRFLTTNCAPWLTIICTLGVPRFTESHALQSLPYRLLIQASGREFVNFGWVLPKKNFPRLSTDHESTAGWSCTPDWSKEAHSTSHLRFTCMPRQTFLAITSRK